jgi:hypothetical protein
VTNATTPTAEAPGRRTDGSARLGASFRAVLLSGAALALPAYALFGVGAAISVAIGTLLAAGNLWVMAKVVTSLLPEEPRSGAPGPQDPAEAQAPGYRRAAWGLVAALKMLALLSVVWLLMRHALVAPFPMLVGLLSLPFGIAIGSLVSDRNAASVEEHP